MKVIKIHYEYKSPKKINNMGFCTHVQYNNKNFNKFACHWSFTIRQVFFKLSLFILYDKLQYDEGKIFRRDLLSLFINKNIDINDPNNVYIKESCKDFNTIHEEYKNWLKTKKDNESDEYPIFFLPAPISNNSAID